MLTCAFNIISLSAGYPGGYPEVGERVCSSWNEEKLSLH